MDKNDRDYSNGEITVHWRPSKCVHSTICYSELRSVFDPGRRPWIRMDKGSTDDIIDIVNRCPTDALTYTRNKDSEKTIKKKEEKKVETKTEDSPTKIQIMQNGPAVISGNFTLTDIYGLKIDSANNIALCRCGKSSSLPFCDGTHNKIGFKENR
ncbi:(4Fe-4S)-binding protein [Bacteroidota bacterium]